jgi:hypothetical protein
MSVQKQKASTASAKVAVATGKKPKAGDVTPKRHGSSRATRTREAGAAMRRLPGAAAIATGLLAATAYALRTKLLGAMGAGIRATGEAGSALSDAAARTREQAAESLERLLKAVGLQRRRHPLLPYAGPVLGLAGGFAAGAAFSYFFGEALAARYGIGDALPDNREDAPPAPRSSGSPTASGMSSDAVKSDQPPAASTWGTASVGTPTPVTAQRRDS